MNTSPLYSLREVTRVFGERRVLDIDTLDIEAHRTYALLGPNGAGKTTLMRVLAFMDAPNSGELFYQGEAVGVRASELSRFRSHAVWVPQAPVMFTGSLLYNVEYPMKIRGMAADLRRQKALDLLERVNLAHLAAAPAHRLSGGETQRAGIARALATGATVLLFDEPTANVDQRSRGEFMALARALEASGNLTLLIATHDAQLAADLCSRQICLHEGKLCERHALPGGGLAWPGRLEHIADGWRLLTAAEGGAGGLYTLRGVAQVAAGVTLRLAPETSSFSIASDGERGCGTPLLDILLTAPECRAAACKLTLGECIQVGNI